MRHRIYEYQSKERKSVMIKFHNAADNDGQIVNIAEVTRDKRAPKYFCIGCGAEMSAVLGDKREHHFRHKEAACSWESYLHKLGKKKLKERFDTSKDFTIGYFVEHICEKSKDCKLGFIYSNQKCNRKEILHINLKELYDTCQEEVTYKGFRADLMLSHSKHPEQEPLFLEISVTHDCEPEKIASGIKIVELKISNEDDILCSLEEKESLFIDTVSENPYSYGTLPAIRFYNFQRKFITRHPLQRFWISSENSGVLRGNCIQDNLDCQNVETNHRDDSIFEVAIPADVLINNQRCNIVEFGMMRAFRNGIAIKHCYFCIHHLRCILYCCSMLINNNVVQQRFSMASLTDKDINKFAYASQCKDYRQNSFLISRIERCYKNLPYWEWKRDEDEQAIQTIG